jgi:hypothetical protein
VSRLRFWDDRAVAEAHRLTRHLHRPVKSSANPVITATEPWESLLSLYGSVLLDEGVLKAWYTMWWLDREPPYGCRAEGLAYAWSDDGVRWRKPHLGLVPEVAGGQNNLVRYGLFADQPCVVRLPDPRPGRRYAMAYYGDFPPDGPGIRVCFSDEGTRWSWPGRCVWRTAVDAVSASLDYFAADDTLTFHHDPARDRFVLARKVMYPGRLVLEPERDGGWRPEKERLVRRIAVRESGDLERWEEPELILAPDPDDPPGTDFHRLGITPRPGGALGLLEVHHDADATVHLALACRPDGGAWMRPCRGQTLLSGEPGAWDDALVFAPSQLVARGDQELLFYGGMEARLEAASLAACRRSGVGLATIDRDRWVSLRASEREPGLLVTRPVALRERVRVDARVGAGGSFEVALAAPDSPPLAGFRWGDGDPIAGDARDRTLAWGGRSLPSAGEYQLWIRMRDADLFAIDPA